MLIQTDENSDWHMVILAVLLLSIVISNEHIKHIPWFLVLTPVHLPNMTVVSVNGITPKAETQAGM